MKSSEWNTSRGGVSRNTIVLISDYEKIKIKIKDIIYVEAQKNYCHFFLKDGMVKTKKPLYMFEQLLGEYGFKRCHRSYIINPLYISAKRREWIILDNQFNIPISYTYNKRLI